MFKKNVNVTKGYDSMSLEKEVEATMAVFTNTVNKLKTTSDNALIEKAKKEEEIKTLKLEAEALNSVSLKALGFVEKIENLFN